MAREKLEWAKIKSSESHEQRGRMEPSYPTTACKQWIFEGASTVATGLRQMGTRSVDGMHHALQRLTSKKMPTLLAPNLIATHNIEVNWKTNKEDHGKNQVCEQWTNQWYLEVGAEEYFRRSEHRDAESASEEKEHEARERNGETEGTAGSRNELIVAIRKAHKKLPDLGQRCHLMQLLVHCTPPPLGASLDVHANKQRELRTRDVGAWDAHGRANNGRTPDGQPKSKKSNTDRVTHTGMAPRPARGRTRTADTSRPAHDSRLGRATIDWGPVAHASKSYHARIVRASEATHLPPTPRHAMRNAHCAKCTQHRRRSPQCRKAIEEDREAVRKQRTRHDR